MATLTKIDYEPVFEAEAADLRDSPPKLIKVDYEPSFAEPVRADGAIPRVLERGGESLSGMDRELARPVMTDTGLVNAPAGDAVDTVGNVENAAKRGYAQFQLAELQKQPNPDLNAMADLQKQIDTLPTSEAYQQFNGAKTTREALTALAENPMTILPELWAESTASFIPAQIKQIPTVANTAIGGAVVGGSAGALAGGVGAVPGTIAGGAAGLTAGMSLASYNASMGIEVSSRIMAEIRRMGLDPSNPDDLARVFGDKEMLADVMSVARTGATPVAMLDAFSAGIAGRLFAKPATSALRKVGRGAVELAAQGAAGGSGQAAGDFAGGGEQSPSAIIGEIAGEGVSSVGEFGAGLASAGMSRAAQADRAPMPPPRTDGPATLTVTPTAPPANPSFTLEQTAAGNVNPQAAPVAAPASRPPSTEIEAKEEAGALAQEGMPQDVAVAVYQARTAGNHAWADAAVQDWKQAQAAEAAQSPSVSIQGALAGNPVDVGGVNAVVEAVAAGNLSALDAVAPMADVSEPAAQQGEANEQAESVQEAGTEGQEVRAEEQAGGLSADTAAPGIADAPAVSAPGPEGAQAAPLAPAAGTVPGSAPGEPAGTTPAARPGAIPAGRRKRNNRTAVQAGQVAAGTAQASSATPAAPTTEVSGGGAPPLPAQVPPVQSPAAKRKGRAKQPTSSPAGGQPQPQAVPDTTISGAPTTAAPPAGESISTAAAPPKSTMPAARRRTPKPDAVATTPVLRVMAGDREIARVRTFQEASQKWEAAREALMKQGKGASDVPPIDLIDADGKTVGHVAWNGRVFEGPSIYDVRGGAKPRLLYENQENSEFPVPLVPEAQAAASTPVETPSTKVEDSRDPWDVAEESAKPYADGLRNLSDRELSAEDRKVSDAINKWAAKTPALLPNGTMNPVAVDDSHPGKQEYWRLSAELRAIGREQDRRAGTIRTTKQPPAPPASPAAKRVRRGKAEKPAVVREATPTAAGEPIQPKSDVSAAVKVETAPGGDVTVSVPSKDKPGIAPKEQKKYLLAEVDAAIETASPDTPQVARERHFFARWELERGDYKKHVDQVVKENRDKFGIVTIEVPGDGEFELLNSKPVLEAFRKRAGSRFPVNSNTNADDSKLKPLTGKVAPSPSMPAAKRVRRSKQAAAPTPTTTEPTKDEQPEPAQPATEKSGLQDFGEKLGGARKDQVASVEREITDDDLAGMTFSEIWPKSEVDAIEDIPQAALATALRNEVPSKPRKGYKVARWVEQVKLVRTIMRYANENGYGAVLARMRSGEYRLLQPLADKVDLLRQLPREQWDRIGKVENNPDAYQYEPATEGEPGATKAASIGGDRWYKKVPTPQAAVEVDGRLVRGKNLAEVTDAVNARMNESTEAAAMQFQVRGPRTGGSAFIHKKGDPLYRKLKVFTGENAAKDALAFVASNRADLVAAWESVKASDNVKETDLRRKDNKPRTGKDHRNGREATPQMFMDGFGFRGVEFGNWVAQGENSKERQGLLNQAYDALMDLADILGIPSRAISLNGTLGLGLGSRGHGWASAHYEPDTLVINLTKTRGAGSLAHELFHAIDHYFQRQRNARGIKGNAGDYITQQPETYYESPDGRYRFSEARFNELKSRNSGMENWKRVDGVRPEVAEAFADLVKALDASPMRERADLIDKGKSDGYWGRIIERAARSFENYIIAKMQEKGYQNDYLANVVDIAEFSRDPGRYPYLLAEELAPVAKAFDDLFGTIQTRETDKGVAMFFAIDQDRPREGESTNDDASTGRGPDADNQPLRSRHGRDVHTKIRQAARRELEAIGSGVVQSTGVDSERSAEDQAGEASYSLDESGLADGIYDDAIDFARDWGYTLVPFISKTKTSLLGFTIGRDVLFVTRPSGDFTVMDTVRHEAAHNTAELYTLADSIDRTSAAFKDYRKYLLAIPGYKNASEEIVVEEMAADILANTVRGGIDSASAVAPGVDVEALRKSAGLADNDAKFQQRGSPITPAQDAEYLKAVESGDMEAAQRMVDEAARAAGYTTGPVFHGTTRKTVTKISPSRGIEVEDAAFFTDNEDMAGEYTMPREYGETVYEDEEGNEIEPGTIVSAYLKLSNPLIVDFNDEAGDATELTKLVREAKSEGNDGLIVENVYDGMTMSGNKGTSYAIFDGAQAKSSDPVTYINGAIIPLSQRFNDTTHDIRYRQSELYSALTRAVEGLSLKQSMPGDQFLNKVRALPGVKAQEIEETGFGDWLAMQKENGRPVTKESALAFLRENGVTVQTVRKGEVVNEAGERESVRSRRERLEAKIAAEGYTIEGDNPLEPDDFYLQDGDGNTVNDWAELPEEMRDTVAEYQRIMVDIADSGSAQEGTKFEGYAPPGGVPGTYRELLLTVPPPSDFPDGEWRAEPFTNANGGRDMRVFKGNREIMVTGDRTAEEAIARAKKLGPQFGPRQRGEEYTSPHWSEPNVIAHMLTDERRIPLDVLAQTQPELAAKLKAQGKTEARALHMIEGQSDLWQNPVSAGKMARKPPLSHSEANAIAADAKVLANALATPAFNVKGFDGLPVDMKPLVAASVLRAVRNNEVRKRVVASIPVGMVDDLRRHQLTPDEFFHDDAMLHKELTAGNVDAAIIREPSAVSGLVRAVMLGAAEVSGRPANLVGIPVDFLTAESALGFHAPTMTESQHSNNNYMPFAGDAWKRLVLRKMLAEAVDGGYDLLTWSTGADRAAKWGSERVEWKNVEPTKSDENFIVEYRYGEQGPWARVRGYESRTDADSELRRLLEKKAENAETQKRLNYRISETATEPTWTVAGKEQSGGEHAGENIEAMARERGMLLEQSGQTVRTKEDLRRIVNGILRNPESGKVDKLTDRIWTRMQTEPEGTSMPRREFFEFLYDKSFVQEANDIVRRMDKGARVSDTRMGEAMAGTGTPIRRILQAMFGVTLEQATEEQARAANAAVRKSETDKLPAVHAIPITDTIRLTVSQGQPMYRQGERTAGMSPESVQSTLAAANIPATFEVAYDFDTWSEGLPAAEREQVRRQQAEATAPGNVTTGAYWKGRRVIFSRYMRSAGEVVVTARHELMHDAIASLPAAEVNQIGRLTYGGKWNAVAAKITRDYGYEQGTPEFMDELISTVYGNGMLAPGLWQRFVTAVRRALRRVGFTLSLNDSELAVYAEYALRVRAEAKTQQAKFAQENQGGQDASDEWKSQAAALQQAWTTAVQRLREADEQRGEGALGVGRNRAFESDFENAAAWLSERDHFLVPASGMSDHGYTASPYVVVNDDDARTEFYRSVLHEAFHVGEATGHPLVAEMLGLIPPDSPGVKSQYAAYRASTDPKFQKDLNDFETDAMQKRKINPRNPLTDFQKGIIREEVRKSIAGEMLGHYMSGDDDNLASAATDPERLRALRDQFSNEIFGKPFLRLMQRSAVQKEDTNYAKQGSFPASRRMANRAQGSRPAVGTGADSLPQAGQTGPDDARIAPTAGEVSQGRADDAARVARFSQRPAEDAEQPVQPAMPPKQVAGAIKKQTEETTAQARTQALLAELTRIESLRGAARAEALTEAADRGKQAMTALRTKTAERMGRTAAGSVAGGVRAGHAQGLKDAYDEAVAAVKDATKDVQNGRLGADAVDKGAEAIKSRQRALRKAIASLAENAEAVGQARAVEAVKTVADAVKAALPLSVRGKALPLMTAAGKSDDPAMALQALQELVDQWQKRSLVAEIKAEIREIVTAKNIAVDYIERMKAMMQAYLVTKPTAATLRTIANAKAYFEAQALVDPDAEVPAEVGRKIEMLADVESGAVKPLRDLDADTLQGVLDDLRAIHAIGITKEKMRKRVWNSMVDHDLEAIEAAGIVPLNDREKILPQIGEPNTPGEKVTNAMRGLMDKSRHGRFYLMPMDVVFDLMDGAKGYAGVMWKTFKARVDTAFGRYLSAARYIEDEFHAKAKEFDIGPRQFQRIGVHAAVQQKNGREKLISAGYTERQIDAVTLTANEMEMYRWMRTALDTLRDPLKITMRKVYNAPWQDVENYFPFLTDYDKAEEEFIDGWMFDDAGKLMKKNVDRGLTMARTGDKRQPIRIDSGTMFIKHIHDANYIIHVGPVAKYLGDLTDRQTVKNEAGGVVRKGFKDLVGDFGTHMVKGYIDLVARKGGVPGENSMRWMDAARRNIGAAQLALRITSALIQPTSLIGAAGLMGPGWVSKGAQDIATSREWRLFVRDNMPEVRNRVGDDPTYLEFGSQSKLRRAQRAGFWVLQRLDALTAASVAAGAYQKYMRDNRLFVDFSTPNAEAVKYAQMVVRRTQSSPYFKDVPLMSSRGEGFGKLGGKPVAKLVLQFQNFVMNEFSYIVHDGLTNAVKNGKYGQGVNILLWTLIASMTANGIRLGVQAGLEAATGKDDDDDKEWWRELLTRTARDRLGVIPFVSQVISSAIYQREPFPVADWGRQTMRDVGRVATGKEPSTRAAGAAGLVFDAAAIMGVPGTGQARQIVESRTKAMMEDRKRRKQLQKQLEK